MTLPPQPLVRLSLRLYFGDHAMFGPGKAELLSHIQETGSIAAAGRQMQMSYKRAWMLVVELNAMFRAPLIESSRGGAKGGGAHLTPAGEQVLTAYRTLEALTLHAGADQIATLQALLGDIPSQK